MFCKRNYKTKKVYKKKIQIKNVCIKFKLCHTHSNIYLIKKNKNNLFSHKKILCYNSVKISFSNKIKDSAIGKKKKINKLKNKQIMKFF